MPLSYDASHPLWLTWVGIIQRCTKPGSPGNDNYSRRGITICPEWLASFKRFVDDVGVKPGKGYSLDRIDNNKGYTKENCRWATVEEQSYNKSTTVMLLWEGVKQPLGLLAKRYNIKAPTAYARFLKGWEPEEILGLKYRYRLTPEGVAAIRAGALKPSISRHMSQVKDMTGQVFERATVIKLDSALKGYARWLCRCSCGKEFVAIGRMLRSGKTRSCGCLLAEYRANLAASPSRKTHGMAGTPTYFAWVVMRRNHIEKVCSEWRTSFEAFFRDMGEKPAKAHLARRDASKDFSAKNCYWAA